MAIKTLLIANRGEIAVRIIRAARLQLVAERADRLGLRADESDADLDTRPGERFVLGDEAVPGMDRVGAAAPGAVAAMRYSPPFQSARRRGSGT